jgi:hypothetical protein
MTAFPCPSPKRRATPWLILASCLLWCACDTTPATGDDVTTDLADAPCQGACGPNESCVGDVCVPSYCPPAGPNFGTHPGDTFTDLVVKDCDGNDVHLNELCGAKAAYFNLLAGW